MMMIKKNLEKQKDTMLLVMLMLMTIMLHVQLLNNFCQMFLLFQNFVFLCEILIQDFELKLVDSQTLQVCFQVFDFANVVLFEVQDDFKAF